MIESIKKEWSSLELYSISSVISAELIGNIVMWWMLVLFFSSCCCSSWTTYTYVRTYVRTILILIASEVRLKDWVRRSNHIRTYVDRNQKKEQNKNWLDPTTYRYLRSTQQELMSSYVPACVQTKWLKWTYVRTLSFIKIVTRHMKQTNKLSNMYVDISNRFIYFHE